jgi:hypothetical protein
MIDSVRRWYERLEVGALLREHRGLHIVPAGNGELVLAGTVHFQGPGLADDVIEDRYSIELRVPPGFPDDEPTVRETDGRIPRDYHKLTGDRLCVAAPTAIRLKLQTSPTLPAYVKHFVIPYLYGHAYCAKHGRLPYGELDHGDEGIRQYLAELFASRSSDRAEEFLHLAGMKKRTANKYPCPCGSGKRLGRCHNRRVNHLRKSVGRTWFRAEYTRVAELLNGVKSYNGYRRQSCQMWPQATEAYFDSR